MRKIINWIYFSIFAVLFIILFTILKSSLSGYFLALVEILFVFSLIILFYFFDKFFNIKFRKRHYFVFILILIFGVILSPMYFIFSQYDKILHFCLFFLGSYLGYFTLRRSGMGPKLGIFFTLILMLALGNLIEIVEYALDLFFALHLQGVYIAASGGYKEIVSRIDDTMIDLILGLAGSICFTIIKLFNYKKEKASWFKN